MKLSCGLPLDFEAAVSRRIWGSSTARHGCFRRVAWPQVTGIRISDLPQWGPKNEASVNVLALVRAESAVDLPDEARAGGFVHGRSDPASMPRER